MPVHAGMNAYFARSGYIRAVAEARERYRFALGDDPDPPAI